MHLVFPSPTAEVARIDVSFLLTTPNLAQPFAEALLRKLAPDSIESRQTFTKWLRLGFFCYLEEKGLRELALSDMNAALFTAYVRWLDRCAPGSNRALWSLGTRASYLLALRNTVDALKHLSKWKESAPPDLHVPTHQWVGIRRRHKPTEVLGDNEIVNVYKVCLGEITEIRTRVEKDLQLIEEGRPDIPRSPRTYRDYPTRAVALAALDELLPHRIPGYPELEREHPFLLRAIKLCFGTVVDLRTALAPSPRQLVPFIVMLAFHTRLNPETLLASELDDFYKEVRLGEPRFCSKPYKGRARRRQRPSAPVDEAWDNPASIYDFLVMWTARIRPLAPAKCANKLFIYLPRTTKSHVAFFDVLSPNGSFISSLLKEFCADHSLKRFTLRQIRATTLDIGRAIFNGDIRASQALGDHRSAETTNSHYTSDAQRKRNEERLGEIMDQRSRWIDSRGKIDTRGAPLEADEGAATPGWRCMDPYQSPYSPHGKLCVAYGYCPVCPLSQVDVESSVACGLLLNLLDAVRRAKSTLDPQGWLERMAPIEKRLIEHWLPRFPAVVLNAARKLSLPALPTPE
ncbi:MAG TPA: hypothetical protein VJL61_12280 [Rhodanobacteraceae bacterium]|nr:hypothetical protein [Rhodanobacteraceae bacterium]